MPGTIPEHPDEMKQRAEWRKRHPRLAKAMDVVPGTLEMWAFLVLGMLILILVAMSLR